MVRTGQTHRRMVRTWHSPGSTAGDDSAVRAPKRPSRVAQRPATSSHTCGSSVTPGVEMGHRFQEPFFSLTPFAEVVGGHEYNHSRIEMHVAKPILYFESDARAVCSRIHSNVAEIGNVCCDVVNSRFGGVRRDRHSELVRRKGIVRTHNSMDT